MHQNRRFYILIFIGFLRKMVKVFSLGGSVIVPGDIDYGYLMKFRRFIVSYAKHEKVVIVCGGGHTARIYIKSLQKAKLDRKISGYIGIRVTRLNAWFVINLFGGNGNCVPRVAKSLEEVASLLEKYSIVITGALRYGPESSSDASAAEIAHMLKSEFINITNVNGVYNKDPRLKDAKFIGHMTFDELYRSLRKIGFTPGQHGILDFYSAKLIKKYKIRTYITGKNLNNLKRLLHKKKFIGTVIDDVF